MRIPQRTRERGLRFNITSLIDVIFLLIIFFLAASHFVRNENLEAVELPEAAEGERDVEEQSRRLVVTITADGTLHVGGKAVDLAAVERLIVSGFEQDKRVAGSLREGTTMFEVRIRGDRGVPYQVVEPILLACARTGVSKVKFAVLDKP